jgi:superoxide dismutase
MAFKLPPLPYRADALAPTISEETISFHYGKHHATYVNTLNTFVEKDPTLAGKTLVFFFASLCGCVSGVGVLRLQAGMQSFCLRPKR